MKRFLAFVFSAVLLVSACQKEPSLTVSGPASLELSADGGSQTFTFTSNRDWTVTSSDSWVSVSPSSESASDNPVTITVKGSANTTYGERNATVTIKAEGLTQSITLRQPANPGLILPTKSFDISSDARSIEVEVQANVQYTVSVSETWIKQTGTKALTSTTLVFGVEENTTYDARNATIIIKPQDAVVPEQVVSVKQAQKDAILLEDTSFEMPYGGGEIEVKIQANVGFEVKSGADWIQYVETKAMSHSTVLLRVAENKTYSSREGKVEIKQKGGSLAYKITVKQAERVAVTDVTLNCSTLSLMEGETATLVATVSPDNATDKNVNWSSDNPAVASVDNGGNVTAIAVGTAKIMAKAGDKSAVCTVTVNDFDYEAERAALIALYNATGGDNWTHKDNWCSDRPLDEWYGIYTDRQHVTVVGLGSNNLTGQIPAEIFSLPKLLSLVLDYNNLAGTIPDEVGNATDMIALRLQHNYLTGAIPESLYELEKLEEIQLWSNKFSDELSEKFWDMPNLEMLILDDNNFTGQLTPAVRKAKNLIWLGLGSNRLTGTIPKEIAELEELSYFSLENHTISNGSVTESANEVTGPIPDNLDKLQKLEFFLVENNNLTGSLPSCFARMPKLIGLELYGNRLSGEIPEEVINCDNWDIWAPDGNIMPQQEGYILSFGHYESTDFTDDGKVIALQTHDEGNGIKLVITGDCFTDKDIANGDFEEIARQTMEDFFAVEPFTTFRNLFDVYAVVAVSKTLYSTYGTALGAQFGEGSAVYCNAEKVKEYSSKAVGNLDETLTIVIVNKNRDSGTAYLPEPEFDTDYGSGFSYACFGLMAQGDTRRLLINHEANGHGFTKLQDEYVFRGSGEYPEGARQGLIESHFSKGFFANVDFESDPAKVKWARFLSDDRYRYDGLGMFEGGMTYEKGVWRPSENSIMAHQMPEGEGSRFNAPSRAAAYIRIHKLAYGATWEFDYEEFVKYDAINRRTSANAAPSGNRKFAIPHTPPVFMKSGK